MGKSTTQTFALHDVFDPPGRVPKETYVDRKDRFGQSLDTILKQAKVVGKPIAIVGPSRQGKTVARKWHFPDAEVVLCTVDSTWTADMIYVEILRQIAPRKLEELVVETAGDVHLGGGPIGSAGGERRKTERSTLRTGTLKDEVIRELKASNRWCVIDDCHLLPDSELALLANGVKAMSDASVKVVIVAAWFGRNRLADADKRPDLRNRMKLITMHWTDDELRQVLIQGQKALNIRFSDELTDLIVASASGLVGRLHLLAAAYCEACEISGTMPDDKNKEPRLYSDPKPLERVRDEACAELAPSYLRYAREAIRGFNPENRAPEEHVTYFGDIARACFDRDPDGFSMTQLLEGITIDDLWKHIKKKYRPRATKGEVKDRVEIINQRQVASELPVLIQFDDKVTRIEDYDFFFYRMWGNLDWEKLRQST